MNANFNFSTTDYSTGLWGYENIQACEEFFFCCSGRCSIVDHRGAVLFDRFVRPDEPVTDYRTRWSGLRPRHLQHGIPFVVAQEQIAAIIKVGDASSSACLLFASVCLLKMQGSRSLLEICVNRRETLCILHQWHEKCGHYNLELTHITKPEWWNNLIVAHGL